MFTPNGLPFFRPFAYRGEFSPVYLVVEQRHIGMISSTPTPWFHVAAKTIENFVARAIQLYEREPGEASASARLGAYVRRWVGWVRAGMPEGALAVPGGHVGGVLCDIDFLTDRESYPTLQSVTDPAMGKIAAKNLKRW